MLFAGALGLVGLGLAGFLVGSIAAGRGAAEPPSLATFAVSFGAAIAALFAIYAFERRQRTRAVGAGVRLEPEPAAAEPPPADAAEAEPAPAAAGPSAAPAPGEPSRLQRCAQLRAEGRFEEAARAAREGLAGDDDAGPLLIELSRAELELGRVDAAIAAARDAHFVGRSRETLAHLLRLLMETRSFAPQDGPTLQRAASRHPQQSLLRHALGVFEAMYGDAAAAERELRAALRLEVDPEARRAVVRDLARVQAARADRERR